MSQPRRGYHAVEDALSTTNHDHHVYVLMGISGSGKSAVASEVAHQLHARFLTATFSIRAAISPRSASGEPLNDDDPHAVAAGAK